MLHTDIIQKLSAADKGLKKILPLVELPQIEVESDIFSALLRSIVSQQLSVKAAATIFGRFSDLMGEQPWFPEHVLALPEERLRGVGFSRPKANYAKNVAIYFQENPGTDWTQIPDDEIIKELTGIKGIGEWTVQMILMFRLGRPDILPLKDLGIQQAMQRLYDWEHLSGKELSAAMRKQSESWKPLRSYASFALWRWKDQGGN